MAFQFTDCRRTVGSVFVLIFLSVSGCSKHPVDPVMTDDSLTILNSLRTPNSRSFYMGFTPWPFDFTESAQLETYNLMAAHSDLVLFHLDNGVPWAESLADQPFPPHVQSILDQMKDESSRFTRIYVSATAQAQDRESLAAYWGEDEHQELPPEWAGKVFDAPEVMTAYIKYCLRLIDFFQPDYFAYGIEVNGALTVQDPAYAHYRTFAEQVYAALKSKHPSLPIFLTFQTGSFEATWEEQMSVNRDLVQFSDYVGMSTYPFWVPGVYAPPQADLSYLPQDWFAQMASIAPEKPFAITETGYIAEGLAMASNGLHIAGQEGWQAMYVDRLLWSIHDLNAEFVIWFVVRDYDQGWERLDALGLASDAHRIWRDTGLFDGAGGLRQGMDVWDRWLALPQQ